MGSALRTVPFDVVYWDTGCPGLRHQVTPKGGRVFIVPYRAGGDVFEAVKNP
jgi:hypothetical protein